MTPDWPSLWEREPGLRPRFEHYDLDEVPLLLERCSSPVNIGISEGMWRAFCRDAAIRFLMRIYGHVHISYRCGDHNWVVVCGNDIFFGPDYDSALIDACDLVTLRRRQGATINTDFDSGDEHQPVKAGAE